MIINKTIATDNLGNDIRISSVFNYENKIDFKNFSAKYVLSGREIYQLNGKTHSVNSGEYIVGNKNTRASIIIDSKEPVKGICIDISRDKLNEVIDFSFVENDSFKKFLFEQEWLTKKYKSSHTKLGYAINEIALKFEEINEGKKYFSNEIFYAIAECIIKDHEIIFSQFQNLKATKESTNGRLFNFIYDAKNYMDDHFLDKIYIEQIAIEAKLSQYHFIRLFKEVFKITPHQYILKKRLQHAKLLLLEGLSVIDVTYETGFSNPANFCKAFKTEFGKSPKKI